MVLNTCLYVSHILFYLRWTSKTFSLNSQYDLMNFRMVFSHYVVCFIQFKNVPSELGLKVGEFLSHTYL